MSFSKSKFVLVFLFAVLLIFFSDNIYIDYVSNESSLMNFFDMGESGIDDRWSNMSFRITMVGALLFGMVFYMEVGKMRNS